MDVRLTPYLADRDLTLYRGDALTVLRQLPAESVHSAITSPPFYGLRDYNVDGQIGVEETPELWCARLVEVFREVRRVLRPDGTCWIEVGDSYGAPGLKTKDLLGAPWMLAFALRADGWFLRADIIWARPNPMPEAVRDRPTKAHTYVFLLSKRPRYFFDAEAVREPAEYGRRAWVDGVTERVAKAGIYSPRGTNNAKLDDPAAGRNVRSVWNITTEAYPDAHFATFPQELVRRCVLAGTSERGCCPDCGAPWRRLVEYGQRPDVPYGVSPEEQVRRWSSTTGGYTTPTATVGWAAGCGHGLEAVPCTVLDPFAGSGTVALVARKHGRRSVGIELSETYCRLLAERTQQLSLLAETKEAIQK